MSGVLFFLLIGVFFLDAFIITSAYIVSRIIFNSYLKKNHRKKWEELVHSEAYVGLNLFAFDKTKLISKFRTDSTDDLGDPTLQQIRTLSIFLFKSGLWGWLGLVLLLIAAGIIPLIQR